MSNQEKIEMFGTPRIEPNPLFKPIEVCEAEQIKPDKIILQVSKARQKADIAINDNFAINVDRKGTIKVYLIDDDVEIPEKISKFDLCVHDAVCNLIEAGNTSFTSEQIYRTMTGLNSDDKITREARRKIIKSMNKLMTTLINIDFSEQVKAHNMDVKTATICGNMIYCKRVHVVFKNNVTAIGYKIIEAPPLFEYSKLIKQVRTLPIDLLKIKNLKDSDNIIVLKNYLLTQIELMRPAPGRRPREKTINYDTIFSECNIKIDTRHLKARFRGYIAKILDSWKEKKYIKNWKEVKVKNSFEKITIDL